MAHGRLLRKLIETGEPMLVAPHSGPGDETEGANPTEHLLVLGVLRADQEVQGILEIFQRVGAPPATQRGYLRFVAQMCDLAGDYLKTRSLRRFGHRQTLWNQIEQFTRAVHRTLDGRSTAYALANEGRRLIECDRVTVAIMKGSKCKIEAISGQDTFDKRANQVTLLEKLSNAVVRQGEPVWYTGSTEDFPPQVEDAVQAYVDESHSKTVAIIPLRREKIVDETKLNQEPEPIVGALVVEQIEDTKLKEGMLSPLGGRRQSAEPAEDGDDLPGRRVGDRRVMPCAVGLHARRGWRDSAGDAAGRVRQHARDGAASLQKDGRHREKGGAAGPVGKPATASRMAEPSEANRRDAAGHYLQTDHAPVDPRRSGTQADSERNQCAGIAGRVLGSRGGPGRGAAQAA
jgi:hypothetical protein